MSKACVDFNPVQSTQTSELKQNWINAFWGKVQTDPSGCFTHCTKQCPTLVMNTECKTCFENLQTTINKTSGQTPGELSIQAQCKYSAPCLDCILDFPLNPTFNDVSACVLPSPGLTVGEIIAIILGSIVGVLVISLVIYYASKH